MFRQAIFEKIAGMSILVDRVTKWYGSQAAVSQVQFELQPGEIVGFLGPNGAGKSTTLKMITGYLQPDEGSTFVGGFDLRNVCKRVFEICGQFVRCRKCFSSNCICN